MVKDSIYGVVLLRYGFCIPGQNVWFLLGEKEILIDSEEEQQRNK